MSYFRFLAILAILLAAMRISTAQGLYFPPATGNTWETMPPSALGWCSDNVRALSEFLGSNGTKAFIVLVNGRIVIEEYFGTFSRDSAHYWASAGKTLTAFLVGIARQNNQLSLSDRTSKYLGVGWTQATREQEDQITIAHQLTMTTGLDDGVPDNHCTTPSCLRFLAAAGTRWAYHNAPYTLLDNVLTAATNQSLNSLVFQHLTQPAGITGLFVRMGFNNVFVSRARSMARFGLLMLNRGNWNGTQILRDSVFFNDMITSSQSLNLSYGYLWWLNGSSSFMLPQVRTVFPGWLFRAAPADMYAALGKNGQILNVIPSRNMVIVRMGDDPASGLVPAALNDEIWRRINNLPCHPTAVLPEPRAYGIHVSPNPAQEFVWIEVPASDFWLEIFDNTGALQGRRKLLSQREAVSLAYFRPGMYFFRITGPYGQVFTRKMIVLGSE